MPTIRDPQTDVSIADYIIDGNWSYNKKVTYNSSLGFTANTDIVDKGYVDSQVIVGPIDEDNIYYIGKHGNDTTSDGKTIADSFLTIQKGINEASLQTPTSSSEYVIKINDGGSYDSFTLVSNPYINIEGNSCKLQSAGVSYIIGDNNSLKFDKGIFVSGSGSFIEKQGTGKSYLKANEISGSNITTAIKMLDGSLNACIKNINITESNTAFSISATSSIDFIGQNVRGKIQLDSGAYAKIKIKKLFGDILISAFAHLQLQINGIFSGNIIIEEGCIVDILIFHRISGVDYINENSSVNIQYIGHHVYSHKNILIGADYSINPRQELAGAGLIGAVSGDYIADNTIAQTSFEMDSAYGENNNLQINAFQNNEYFGILIPVEKIDLVEVIGHKVSLSLRAAWTRGTVHDVRMAILGWTGTANEINTKVVNVWGETPVLSNWWIYTAISDNLSFNDVGIYETFKLENISVTTQNIAVFIWTTQEIRSFPLLEISNVRCNKGNFAENFAVRPFTEELRLCRRYYSKGYDLNTLPISGTYISSMSRLKGASPNEHILRFTGMIINYPTYMFKTPKITPYAPKQGQINHVQYTDNLTTPAVQEFVGKANASLRVHTLYISANFRYNWTADARF